MRGRPRCPHCQAKRPVKAGMRKTHKGLKQMYRCRVCGRKFTPGKYSRMRVSPETVRRALRLRDQGMSYRMISAALLVDCDINVSDVAVMKWVKKYMGS